MFGYGCVDWCDEKCVDWYDKKCGDKMSIDWADRKCQECEVRGRVMYGCVERVY